MSTTIDPLFGLIRVSSSIKIKRSDGRIHLAKVVQLSPESKSVGVEWNEHGEVKGKEILLDLVFELNNELRPSKTFKQSLNLGNQHIRPTAHVPISSTGLSSSRLTLDIDALEREYSSRPPPTLPPHLLQESQQYPTSVQTTSTPLPPPPIDRYIFFIIYCSLYIFCYSALLQLLRIIRTNPITYHRKQIIQLLFVQFVVLLLGSILHHHHHHHQKQLRLHLLFHLVLNNHANHKYRFHFQ